MAQPFGVAFWRASLRSGGYRPGRISRRKSWAAAALLPVLLTSALLLALPGAGLSFLGASPGIKQRTDASRIGDRAAVTGGMLLATSPSVAQAQAVAAEPFQFLGLGSSELFPFSNISLLTWLLLIFLPGWKYIEQVALVAPVANALLYALALAHLLTHPAPDAPAVDFTSLGGIVTAFRNPDSVYAGWLHYCVFDPLVGLGEVIDSKQQRVNHLLVVPCLLLTLLFGPVGFLSYLLLRTVTILQRGGSESAA
ncbi:unnamed protein product [Polarella glacialis]|uniref:DUF4281 domain-containing protein n=1 Tax=Polarella glacialis TaxID=89957 RepID=A0A813GQG4_POLGL|nr:unnamed protein product [Polarella glacialis]CAE8634237.1 unnamed protein product [Polarella glacialis]